MQSANLIGNLTKDLELKYTSSGMAVGTFSIACNRKVKKGEAWVDEASFFDCKMWGKRAESLAQYMTKGTKVGLSCEVVQERWEYEGRSMSKVVFIVSEVELLGSKPQQKPQAQGCQQQGDWSNQEFKDDIPDSDSIPF